MPRIIRLSSHCLIDQPTHLLAFRYRRRVVALMLRLLFLIDPKMHFTWPAGPAWWLLGATRSSKNPNICTL